VISQSPTADAQVPSGTTIAIVVSTGPLLATVPNVLGLPQATAQANIESAGLGVGAVSLQASASLPPGAVLAQNPAGGSQVPVGSDVSLTVSAGVVVPTVVGQTQSAAQSAINDASLTVGVVTTQASATVPSGNVISQSPSGGTQVAAGSAVSLVISSGSAPVTAPSVDRTIFSDGAGTRTTSRFSTTSANEQLVAFVSADGPSSGTQIATVSGAGLTWTLVRRANTQRGTSEIWTARAPSVLSNVTVTSTLSSSSFRQSLTVVTFKGASRVGTSVAAGGASGAPSLSFTSSTAHSLVYAVGNDWDRSTSRTLGTGQTMIHEVVDTNVGDTFWAQARSTEVASAGVLVQMNCTAPTGDRWNLAAVEIIP
jgi:beta-lactam-binding protein with PASTA domain